LVIGGNTAKALGLATPRPFLIAVLKYKRTRNALRESALKKLAALSQRHRLGY
jgi:hypothetical protein